MATSDPESRATVLGRFRQFYKAMGEPDSRDALALLQNPPMALSNKEKQEAFRARNALLGMTEVRGIYLPPALHATLKAEAKRLLKRKPSLPEPPKEER